MESQNEGGFGPPRAVTPWKKNTYMYIYNTDIYICNVFTIIKEGDVPFTKHMEFSSL
jgi:hypothetical protein